MPLLQVRACPETREGGEIVRACHHHGLVFKGRGALKFPVASFSKYSSR